MGLEFTFIYLQTETNFKHRSLMSLRFAPFLSLSLIHFPCLVRRKWEGEGKCFFFYLFNFYLASLLKFFEAENRVKIASLLFRGLSSSKEFSFILCATFFIAIYIKK